MNRPSIRGSLRWRVPALLAALLLLLFSAATPPTVAAQGGNGAQVWRWGSLRPGDVWNTLVVEMTVRRRQINAEGATVGVPSPTGRYRLERSMASGSWKTVVTVLSLERASLYSLDGVLGSPAPLAVARIEDDENGTPVRVFDSLGRSLRLPELTASALSAAGVGAAGGSELRAASTSWIDGFVAASDKAAQRRLALEREFGAPTTVNGLTRFAKTLGTTSAEVLVQPTAVVALEANLAEGARLVAHRTFTYQPAYQGAMVRSAVHSELRLSSATDERQITDTAFANIALERR